MDENAFVVAETTELVGLQSVLLGFGVIDVAFASAVTPRTLDHAFLAEEVSGLHGVAFIGGAEDHPVAEIQRQDLGLVVAKGGNKRGR